VLDSAPKLRSSPFLTFSSSFSHRSVICLAVILIETMFHRGSETLLLALLCVIFFAQQQTVTAKYNLPAGVLEQIGLEGQLKETFKCEADGYFADVENG